MLEISEEQQAEFWKVSMKFQWLPDKVSGTNRMVPDTGYFVPDIERIDIPDISGIPVYVQIPVLAICIIKKYRYTELSVFHCVIPFAGFKHCFKSNLHCL